MNVLKKSADRLAESWLLRSGKTLWLANEKNWNLPLSKFQKLSCGLYIILKDYAIGKFPPQFLDQQKAYEAEIEYQYALPGTNIEEIKDANMRKPFWFGAPVQDYLSSFLSLLKSFERLGIRPPARLLELGCGSGWTAEFLSMAGFDVLGTTISQHEVDDANHRIESMKTKRLKPALKFLATPMEDADSATREHGPFDAVFVFEAIHHAYDWRKACDSAFKCLKPGGWFLLCSEPNVLHAAVSYRIARLSGTHEIGFRRSELIGGCRDAGFEKFVILKNRFGFLMKSHWIAAQRLR